MLVHYRTGGMRKGTVGGHDEPWEVCTEFRRAGNTAGGEHGREVAACTKQG